MQSKLKLATKALALIAWSSLLSATSQAGDLVLMVNGGHGSQSSSQQDNSMFGADVLFWQHQRSDRQTFFIGTGFTKISTDAMSNRSINAISVFPQINLYAKQWGSVTPLFFVRALGPTWLSDRRLGDRQQGASFSLQAQVGGGILFGKNQEWMTTLSYKHFSNAGLASPNQAFDMPWLISVGYQFSSQ